MIRKNIFSLIAIIFIQSSLYAQITLTRPDFPVQNDVIREISQSNSYSEGASGTNIIWDFSTMNLTSGIPPIFYSSLVQPCIVGDLRASFSPGMAGYHMQFETDVSKYDYREYDYYLAGPGGNSYGYCYLTPWKKMYFPFSYGDSIMCDFDFSTSYYDGMTTFYNSFGTGYDTTICDGWGTLILSSGSYDVLRTVSYVLTTDTNPGFYPYYTTYYQIFRWYTNLNKCPIVTISYAQRLDASTNQWLPVNKGVVLCSFITNTGLSENFPENYLTLNSTSNNTYSLIFKEAPPGKYMIDLFDIQGKQQLHRDICIQSGNETIQIDASTFSSGLFLVRVLTPGNMLQTFKLIIP